LLRYGAKNNWVNLDPPSMITVIKPICMEFPPDSIIIAGMIVSTSIKFLAKARKAACHKNA